MAKNLHGKKIVSTFAPSKPRNGSLAEWLGTGLQNRLQQFESARNLGSSLAKAGFFHYNKAVI